MHGRRHESPIGDRFNGMNRLRAGEGVPCRVGLFRGFPVPQGLFVIRAHGNGAAVGRD